MFTDNFKRTIRLLLALTAMLLAAYLWLSHSFRDMTVPQHDVALPKDDRALVTYDENRHTVTTTTPSGTTREYSRNPTVEIRKDGTVRVDAHKWGVEARPFLGGGYSDTGRLYVGCQFFYARQFDAGASFGWTADNRRPAFQPMLSLGWNFWSSASLNVGANPIPFILQQKPELAVFISLRV